MNKNARRVIEGCKKIVKKILDSKKSKKKYFFKEIECVDICDREGKRKLKDVIKEKLSVEEEIDREKLEEYKEDIKFEIEKAECEKENSMTVNLPYLLLLPAAMISFVASFLLNLPSEATLMSFAASVYVNLAAVILYTFFVMKIMGWGSRSVLKERRKKIFFLNIIEDILNEIEGEIYKRT